MPRITDFSHSCEICGRHHASRQAKSKHKKNCQGEMREIDVLRAQIVAMQIQLQVPKTNTTNSCNIGSVGNGNTINTTVNNYTINNVGKENVDYITNDDIRKLIKAKNLYESLQTIIKMIHFNPEHPENVNVYVPNYGEGHHFENGQWKKMELQELAQNVVKKDVLVMAHHIDTNTRRFKNEDVMKVESLQSNIRCQTQARRDCIQTMIENHGIVKEIHNIDF